MIKFLQKHKKKFAYGIGGFALFYTLFGFFGVPVLIEKGLPKILQNRANFSVEKAKFNPFTYELNITNPALSTYKPLFLADRIDAKLKFSELLNKTIDIQNVYLKNPKINVERENNGTFNFEPLYAGGEEEPSSESNSSINIRLDSLKIDNGEIAYNDESLKKPFNINLKNLNYELAGLNLASNFIGNHDLNVTSGTFDNLAYSGGITLNPLKIYGKIDLENLKINPFWLSFLDVENLQLLNGKISANLDYNVIVDKDVKINLANSELGLNEIAILAEENLISFDALSLPKIDFVANFGEQSDANLSIGEISLKNTEFLNAESNASLGTFDISNFELNFSLDGTKFSLNSEVQKSNLSDVLFFNPLIALNEKGAEISQIKAEILSENNTTKINANTNKIEILPLNLTLGKTDKISLANLIADDFAFSTEQNGSNLSLNSAKFGEISVANKAQNFAGIKNFEIQKIKFNLENLALNIAKIAINAPFFNSEINETGAKSINDLSIISYQPSSAESAKFRQNLRSEIAKFSPEANFTKFSENNKTARSVPAAKNEPKFSFGIDNIELVGGSAKITESFVAPNITHNLGAINASVSALSSNFARPFSANLSLSSDEVIAKSNGKITINPLNLDINFDLSHPDLRKANPYISEFLNAKIGSGSANVSGNFKMDKSFNLSAKAAAKNLTLNEPSGAKVFGIGSANAAKIALNESKIDISGVQVVSPYAKIHIAKNGNINLSKLAKSAPKNSAPKAKNTKKQSGNFGVNIQNISISNGSFNFIDDSLFLPLNINVSQIKTSVDKISDKSVANLKFNGLVGKSGLAQIALKTYPFNYESKTDLNVVLKDVALSDATPYSAKFIGYKIEGGKTNLKLNYKIANSKLTATNDINLDNLVLGEKVESKDALNLPLDLAISILKDSDGQINVSLPISGNLDDPKFNFGGVVVGAVTKLFGDIVLSPFRFLGKIAGVDTASLDGIDFEPASSEILISENEKIANLATIAKSKPEIKLTLTPTYNEKLDSTEFKRITLEEHITMLGNKNGLSTEAAIANLKTKYHIKESGDEGYQKLIGAQKFTSSRLETLAQNRAKAVQNALANLGVNSSQIVIKKPKETEAKQDSFISLGLGIEK